MAGTVSAGAVLWGASTASAYVCAATGGSGGEPRPVGDEAVVDPAVASAAAAATEKIGLCGQLPEPLQQSSARFTHPARMPAMHDSDTGMHCHHSCGPGHDFAGVDFVSARVHPGCVGGLTGSENEGAGLCGNQGL